MQIQFKMEGGLAHFPGLSRPVTIDSDKLPETEAAELERLINAAHLFDRTISLPAPGAADYRQYTITLEEGQRHHTVQLVDPIQDPDLQALLNYLQAKMKTQRRDTTK